METRLRSDFRTELRSAVAEILDAINGKSMALREDLNRQFERAKRPVKLDTAPGCKA